MDRLETQLLQITLCDDPYAWQSLGFNVVELADGKLVSDIGGVQIRFEDSITNQGIICVKTQGVRGSIDSLEFGGEMVKVPSSSDLLPPFSNPNGVSRIDHLVVTTPDCDRTSAALQKNGIDPRRVRTFGDSGAEIRQTFFWLGNVILELVGPDKSESGDPALFWGLALISENIDATVHYLGDACTPLKRAVQPGRKITTIKTRDIGINTSIAVMSPHAEST